MHAAIVETLVHKAKFTPDTALAIAEAIDMAIDKAQLVTTPILDQRLATLSAEMRAEFTALRAEMGTEFTAVRGEMAGESATLRGEMRTEFTTLRAEMRTEFAAVRGEMAGESATLRGEMRAEFTVVRGEMTGESATLRGEMRAGFAALETQHHKLKNHLILWIIGTALLPKVATELGIALGAIVQAIAAHL